MLARCYNIRSPAEVEAERAAQRPAPNPVIIADPPRYMNMTREEKAVRNQSIEELWLAKHPMQEIADILVIPLGTVASVINKLGLQGRGGKCKKFIKRIYKTPQLSETA